MALAQSEDLQPLPAADWGSDGGEYEYTNGAEAPVPADVVKAQSEGGLFTRDNLGQVLLWGGVSLIVGMLLQRMR